MVVGTGVDPVTSRFSDPKSGVCWYLLVSSRVDKSRSEALAVTGRHEPTRTVRGMPAGFSRDFP